jgi:ceramide glucosyltransferase
MRLLLPCLFALGCFGLLTSTVYSGLVLWGVHRFRARRRRAGTRSFVDPVSLLKPLHGYEPGMEAHLRSFFEQDYPGFEILFCARRSDDVGLSLARKVAGDYPSVPAQFLVTGEPPYANAKAASLERMAAAARHEILVISDSDVRVGPEYLRAVVAPFADGRTGVVTCLYRGVAMPPEPGGPSALWAQLEGIGMSVEMTGGVLVAEMLEGMKFALGPTMAVRRGCVTEMGGFARLGEYCSDDFLLGNWIAANGHRVVLSDHVIDHMILNESFAHSMRHQARWMKSTRFSRPKGHFGTALTFAVPFGVLAGVAGALAGHPWVGLAALLWSLADRMGMAAAIGALVLKERPLWRTVLLYPLRDLLGFGFWAASYGSNRILWRGEVYVLEAEGRMRRVRGKAEGVGQKAGEARRSL